ncbi:MAG: XRE family transcriptional regulator [Clostridia bacterium]|nr:XRE family transcriptional regulator [Clostridia bacterium]
MSLGSNIAKARKAKDLSQEELSVKVGVTNQAVSLWERDEAVPETGRLVRLAEALGVTVNDLMYDREGCGWELKSPYFDAEHMYTFVRTKAVSEGWNQVLSALPFMREKHRGQVRKGMAGETYAVHPLTVACHVMAMGIRDEDVIAAALLHDTVEDTGTRPEELPVNDRTRGIVCLLSYNTYDGEKNEIKPLYYENIAKNPAAALIKCTDRCHNLSTMADECGRGFMENYIRQTERYFPPLLETIRNVPEYSNAAWLLKNQIMTLTEIYKRLV